MTAPAELTDRVRPCADPECAAGNTHPTAEPEQDGDHTFYTCTACGYQFGYRRLPVGVMAANNAEGCPVGIPESIRRQAHPGGPPTTARPLPLLHIGRAPHAEPA